MKTFATAIPEVLILEPKRFHDARGFFTETYNKRTLAEAGILTDFVQDNLSFSAPIHTLRGLHFQRDQLAQAKLVSVLNGSVLDVVVDLRASSPCFGRHFATKLIAEMGLQLFVPIGFAHGFVTLEPNSLFSYKTSAYYSQAHEDGIRFDDPELAIDWGVPSEQIVISEKDRQLPRFDRTKRYF
jgi:dTDP-4-dehydrorhamnose 3,5-epimerase